MTISREERTPLNILDLPAELLSIAVLYLPGIELRSVFLVCKKLNGLLIKACGIEALEKLSKVSVSYNYIKAIYESLKRTLNANGEKILPFPEFIIVYLEVVKCLVKHNDPSQPTLFRESKSVILRYFAVAELPKGVQPTDELLKAMVTINNLTLARDILSKAYNERAKKWESEEVETNRKALKDQSLAELEAWKSDFVHILIEKSPYSEPCKTLALEWISEIPSTSSVYLGSFDSLNSLSYALLVQAKEIAQTLFEESYKNDMLPKDYQDTAFIAFSVSGIVDIEHHEWLKEILNKIFERLDKDQKNKLLLSFKEKRKRNKSLSSIIHDMKYRWERLESFKLSFNNKVKIESGPDKLLNELFCPNNLLNELFRPGSLNRHENLKDTTSNSGKALSEVYSDALFEERSSLTQEKDISKDPQAKLWGEVQLLFALLQGNNERIQYITKKAYKITPDQDSLSWMLEVLLSLKLTKTQVIALDTGLGYLFKSDPTLGENLPLPHLIMLITLGLPNTLDFIASIEKYNQNLWLYTLNEIEAGRISSIAAFLGKTKEEIKITTPKRFIEEFIPYASVYKKFLSLDYIKKHSNGESDHEKETNQALESSISIEFEVSNRELFEFTLDNRLLTSSKMAELLDSFLSDSSPVDSLIVLNRWVQTNNPLTDIAAEKYLDAVASKLLKATDKDTPSLEDLEKLWSHIYLWFYFSYCPTLMSVIDANIIEGIARRLLSRLITSAQDFINERNSSELPLDDSQFKEQLTNYLHAVSSFPQEDSIEVDIAGYPVSCSLGVGLELGRIFNSSLICKQVISQVQKNHGEDSSHYQSLLRVYEAGNTLLKHKPLSESIRCSIRLVQEAFEGLDNKKEQTLSIPQHSASRP